FETPGDGSRAEGHEDLSVRGDVMRDTAADPVRDADEVLAVALVEVLGAERSGHGEVDRLAGPGGEPLQHRRSQLDEALPAVSVSESKENGTGGEPPAVRRALDEPTALERADEAGGRALRQAGVRGELADRE